MFKKNIYHIFLNSRLFESKEQKPSSSSEYFLNSSWVLKSA
ncbi:hypothetical protein ACV3UL_16325 [Clostridium perfringens]